MNNYFHKFITLLLITISLISQSNIVLALTRNEIKHLAKKTTVLINRENLLDEGQTSIGSGVVIGLEKNDLDNNYTYYILTANHVVIAKNNYQVQTYDGKKYLVNVVKEIPGGECVDLAVLQFNSSKIYPTAKFGKVEQKKDSVVYIYGWAQGKETKLIMSKVLDSKYHGYLNPNDDNCYYSAYNNIDQKEAERGMSGGAILNDEGHLVGIHIAEVVFGPDTRGTSIKTFLKKAPPEILSAIDNASKNPTTINADVFEDIAFILLQKNNFLKVFIIIIVTSIIIYVIAKSVAEIIKAWCSRGRAEISAKSDIRIKKCK